MQKELGKEETDILENLKRKKRIKKVATIAIITILLVIVGVFIVLLLTYFQSPEKTLGIGANIESALLNEQGNLVYVKLLGGSDKNITKIKFIFTDEQGNEYYYETSEGISEIEIPYERSFWDWLFRRQFTGVFDYEISADELNLENFENINEVSVSFEYYEEGEIVETGVLDTTKTTTKTTTTGGGSPSRDGGTTTCTTGTWTDTNEYKCDANNSRERKQTRTVCGSEASEQWIIEDCEEGYECVNGSCEVSESTEYHAIISDVSASPGATSVSVPVSLNNIGSREIIGIDITLNYDSNLITAVDVQKGSLTPDWNLEKNIDIEGQARIALYHSDKLTSSGEIAKIIFDVKSTAPIGSASALTLAKFDANEIPVTNIINGIFTIQSIQQEGELGNLASILSAIQGIINKVQSILYGIIK